MDSCLQASLEEIQRATEGMSADQLAWHPPGKWSSADILEHLTLTFTGTAKGMRRVLVDDGVRVFGPGSGSQACGETGEGRLVEPALARRLGPDLEPRRRRHRTPRHQVVPEH